MPIRYFPALLLFAVPAAAQAPPSAEAILAKYVEALGGREAIEKQKSRVSKGSIEVTNFGASGVFEQYAKAPNKVVSISSFEGYGTVTHCFDGQTAWSNDPDNGQRDLEGPQAARARLDSEFHRALKLKDLYTKLTVAGTAKVGESEAYVVEAVPAEGAADKLYFDAASGLLLKTERAGEATVVLEDYRPVGGVKVPFLLRSDGPQYNLIIKFSDVTADVPVEDAKFAKPAK